MMSLTNYSVIINYDIISSIQDDWLKFGTPGYSIGLVSNACGLAPQRGCEGVYQNGGTQRPMGQCMESDHNIGKWSKFPCIAGRS